MSITDELRAYAGSFYLFCYKDVREKLDAIADSIDAEYQKAIRELNNLADASVLLPVDPKCIQRKGCNEFSPCGLYEAVRNDSLRQRVAVQPRLLDLQA